METWNEIIVKSIQLVGRPLMRREIYDVITNDMGYRLFYGNLGVHLANAKKQGVLAHIKIPPSLAGYYCQPDWVENGKLKPEHKYDPFWDLRERPNTNTQIKI